MKNMAVRTTSRIAVITSTVIAYGIAVILSGLRVLARSSRAGSASSTRQPPMEMRHLSEESSSKRRPRPGSAAQLLGAASTVIVALTAIAALAISLVTLVMQLRDRTATEQAAQQEYAQRVAFWWTLNSTGLAVTLHVQNSNSLPVTAWTAHLPDDKQSIPGTVPEEAYFGASSVPPSLFIGQIPPCTVVSISGPFAHFPGAQNIAPLGESGLLEGDVIITDPTGRTWVRTLSGGLDQADSLDLMITQENTYEFIRPSSPSSAPTCG
jgi:hypothetical protein